MNKKKMSKLDEFVKIIFTILFFVEANNCDSLNNLPRYRRQAEHSQNVSCQLPPHPPRGEWTLYKSQQLQPGDSVAPASILVFKCNKNYIFKGADIVFCMNDGSWSDSLGVCEKLCPPLNNTASTTVTCRKESTVVDCAQPDEGTRAEFYCEPFYENRESKARPRVCHEGSWDQPRQICEPSCGLKIPRPQSLLASATNAIEGDYPWHVGLYRNTVDPPTYLCGGSLISQNVILTAAHCVTNIQNGALLPKDSFSIAAGKYYSRYEDPRDVGAQYRKLKHIYLMPSWRGEALLYQGDIAILITDEILQLSRYVQPVCIDYDGGVTQLALQNPNPVGTVVGWGGDTAVAREIVKHIALSYIGYDKCLKQFPENFQKYFIQDKFCTGYVNEGTPFCCGVSGNGFVFRNPKDDRFYLTGIVGLSPNPENGNFDKNQYILLTNVTQYARNIIEKVAAHRVTV